MDSLYAAIAAKKAATIQQQDALLLNRGCFVLHARIVS
jgi:hypothetical protein